MIQKKEVRNVTVPSSHLRTTTLILLGYTP